ncbi:MAG: helix-turn-helix domain-containing protein [Lewinella sp.]
MKLIVDFVLVIGIVLSVLPIVGIMRLSERRAPQYILIAFWVLILNTLVYFYAMLHELSAVQFATNFLQHGVRLLIPPLLYVYVKSIFLEPTGLIRGNIKHFIVFIVYFLGYIIPLSIDPNADYIYTIHRYIPNWAVVHDLFGIVYFFLALKLFYSFRKLMKHNYSSIKEKDFLWIEKFLIGFTLVLVIDLIVTFTEIAFGYNVSWDAYITIVFLVATMAHLGRYGLTQSTVFLPEFLIEDIENQSTPGKANSTYLKPSEKEELRSRFTQSMQEEKMYLSPDLSSKSLATAMKTSERKLSAFFSEVLDSNFYDTINYYRVEEAKRVLQTEALKNHSINGIAHSCGFSSKSSFYRIFKKHTNQSPLAYVKTKDKGSHRP